MIRKITTACFYLHNFAHAEFLQKVEKNEGGVMADEDIADLAHEFGILAGSLRRRDDDYGTMIHSLNTISVEEQTALIAQQERLQAVGPGERPEFWRESLAHMAFRIDAHHNFAPSTVAQNIQLRTVLQETVIEDEEGLL